VSGGRGLTFGVGDAARVLGLSVCLDRHAVLVAEGTPSFHDHHRTFLSGPDDFILDVKKS
jgi:hypothetical protein